MKIALSLNGVHCLTHLQKRIKGGEMKILKSEWKPSDRGIINTGNMIYQGSLHLLVDYVPKVTFKKIGNFFYGENEGYVRLYKHEPGTKDGFAGRTITLNIEGVGEMDFKGCLWDPFSIPDDIPKFFCVGITTDPKVFDRGFTYTAGKITWELAKEIIDSLGVDVKLRRF